MNDLKTSEVIKGILTVIIAVLISFWATPFIRANQNIINIIATVFSILAGFLMGMVAFVTDPGGFFPGDWKVLKNQKKIIKVRLAKQQALFYLYLISILLIVVSMCINDKSQIKGILEHAFVFFAALSFIFSFGIPRWMKIYQLEKIDVLIEHRKQNDSKPQTDNPVVK